MSARLEACLVVALLIAAAGSAGAASLEPSVRTPPLDPAAAAAASAAANSSIAPYNQAALTDPYNRQDYSTDESFGLTAAQMLGAAAACEQLHADQVSMSGQAIAKGSKEANEENRANIDAAQQYLLDPAATTPGGGEADCDRVSGAFGQLQQIQLHNQNLAKDLDEPDAIAPNPIGKGNQR